MELRHLRYFLAVAEELHFGRAAARIHIAQPPLSQQIQQLEKEIGVKLFARTKRSVRLTEAGRVFRRDVYSVFELLEKGVLKAKAADRGETGRLSIGFIGSATYEVLPAVLRAFRDRYPEVELDLQEIESTEQNQALLDRRINISFARFPRPNPELVFEAICSERLIVALPIRHPLNSGSEVTLVELAREPFILFPHQPSAHASHTLQFFANAGCTPSIVQTVGAMHTALGLVAADIGVTIVPSSMRSMLREGIEFRELAPPAPLLEMVIGYRADDTSSLLDHFKSVVYEVSSGQHPND
jgi:DNA-binding transcriptional LysR family regulator